MLQELFEQQIKAGAPVCSAGTTCKRACHRLRRTDPFADVDAVGVTKSKKSAIRTLEHKPSVSLKKDDDGDSGDPG